MATSHSEALRDRCREVLDANWLGRATKPAPRLYPHQWSWDSAFIAIGNRHHRWDRSALELRTLFEAQWSNGMLPHIVFETDRDDDYFPSVRYWGVRDVVSPAPPKPTSGICQPPIHAIAARLVVEAARSDGDGIELARDLVPRLTAWHDYLHRSRTVDGALVEVWHPWETGMDNSPAWDAPLSRLRFTPDEVPRYRRVDTTLADAAVRPSDIDYDRYAYLVARLRQDAYRPADLHALPFRVRDVLFNSALARAELDLGALIDLVGGNGDPRRARGRAIADAVEQQLWSEPTGWYLSQDAVTGELLAPRTVGGMMPLLFIAPDDDPSRIGTLLRTFDDTLVVALGDGATALLTTGRTEPSFDPIRYWRGPTWVNTTWLAAEGLRRAGHRSRADQLVGGILQLVGEVGVFEYFEPTTRTGHGSDDFSWTAALALDLLERQTGTDIGGSDVTTENGEDE